MKKIAFLFMTGVILHLSAFSQTLTAHFDFNGISPTATTVPDLVSGLTGTITGPFTPASDRIYLPPGTNISFSGGTALDLPKWTISINVTFRSFNTATCQVNNLITHGTPGRSNYYALQTDDNNWERTCASPSVSAVCATASQNQQFYGLARGGATAWSGFPCSPILQVNVPYCLVATYDGALTRLYVNGILWNTLTMYPFSSTSSADPLIIGSLAGGFLDATVEDIKIWDDVLSAAQISVYQCSSPISMSGSCSDSFCYWTLTGNTISGTNNILGTKSNDDIRIFTSNKPVATLTSDGNLDFGAANNLLPGNVKSAAFGSGNVLDSCTNSEAIGFGNTLTNARKSIAAGEINVVAAENSGAFGYNNHILNKVMASFAFGNRDTILNASRFSMIAGQNNVINRSYSAIALGNMNRLDSCSTSTAGGQNNQLYIADACQAYGVQNHISSSTGVALFGTQNAATQSRSSMANGSQNRLDITNGDLASGQNNVLLGVSGANTNNSALGQNNSISASTGSGIIGIANMITNASASFVAGAGNLNNGSNNTLLGYLSTVNGSESVVIGKANSANGRNIHLFGDSVTSNLNNTMVFGFNNRTAVITKRGLAVQMNSTSTTTYVPAHNLEVDASAFVASGVIHSNIAFANLPAAPRPLPVVVNDPVTGELYSGSIATNYLSSEGVSLNGNVFSLGDACGGGTSNPFLSHRAIDFGLNKHLYFNTNDNGKLFMGRSACQPLTTRLEISASGLLGAINNYNSTAPSTSGLRFSSLSSQTIPIPSVPSAGGRHGVLSLDSDGDVIWVEDQMGASLANNGCSAAGGFVQLGEDCSNPAVPNAAELTSDRAVPLHDFNFIFRDGSLSQPGQNRVGVGTSCMPGAKLEVIRNQEGSVYDAANRCIAGINNDLAVVRGPSGIGEAIGIYGKSSNRQNMANLGGDFLAVDAIDQTIGVRGVAQSNNGNAAFGGWFSACGAQGNDPTGTRRWNIGVYGEVCNQDGWAGFFNGDMYCATSGWTTSDVRLKKNIEPISDALGVIAKIQPKKYEFNTLVYPKLHLPANTENYGVLAQDLEQILPSLVKETLVPGIEGFAHETIKTVNYTQLIPFLIQAVKEQQAQIVAETSSNKHLKAQNDALNARIEAMEQKFKSFEQALLEICETGCPGIKNSTKNEDDKYTPSGDSLYQSFPNPTDGKVVISYFINGNYKDIVLLINDMNGRQVQTVPIQPKKGSGMVTIDLSSLSAQSYVYTLVADQNKIGSKVLTVVK